MGMPWDRRGARSEEHIALLRTLWCADGDLVEFHGEFHDLPPMDPEPRPVQRPIPILIGGHSDIALDRAGRIGDGWIAAQMSPERVTEHWPRGGRRRRAQRARPRVGPAVHQHPGEGRPARSATCSRSTATSASTTCRSACTATPRRRPSTGSATSPRMCCPDCAREERAWARSANRSERSTSR